MRICRSALAIGLRHPIYLGVYVLFLSLLGIFLTIGSNDETAATSGYAPAHASIAIIDRDGSALAGELGAYLAEMHDAVDIEDESFELQDALATNLVDAVVIIPEGFGAECLDRGRAGGELPTIQIAYGSYTQGSALVETQAVRWVALAGAAAALEPDADAARVAELVAAAAPVRAETHVENLAQADGPAKPFQAYLNFSTYSITCSVVVCAGLVLTTMNGKRLRARALASPMRPRRLGVETLAACFVLVVCVWAVSGVVGVVASGVLTAGVGFAQVALALAAMLVFALVPLALAFALAQLRMSEEGLNALGNIGGMLMSFLGGAWVPLDVLSESVQVVARFAPTFWANDAIAAVLAVPELTVEVLTRYAIGVGVTALFAVAITCVGFAATRSREA